MSNRNFSDAIKLEVVKTNLEKNNGTICCEICGIKLTSIKECHFDHIQPFAKGGRSTFDNCQLLCVDCNLKKNDKELKDFVLEEKAKKFLGGESLIDFQHTPIEKTQDNTHGEMTKEAFNKAISDFIREKGNISSFTRIALRSRKIWFVSATIFAKGLPYSQANKSVSVSRKCSSGSIL